MKKVLLDENLPRKLKVHFAEEFEVFTVPEMKWNAFENGHLLTAMKENGFQFLITSDQNLIHQQNLDRYQIKVIVIVAKDNQYETIMPLIDKIINAIRTSVSNCTMIE